MTIIFQVGWTFLAPKDVTEGSFSRMTNAAGALASQAATQAAEFFGKSEDSWNQSPNWAGQWGGS